MKKELLFTAFTVLACCWFNSNLSAQTTLLFTTYLLQDDNAFETRVAYKDLINNSSVMIGQRFGGETWSIYGYYNPEILVYDTNRQLNNHSHKFGLSGSFGDSDVSFTVNSTFVQRNYGNDYSYYNVDRYLVQTGLSYHPGFNTNTIIGVSVSRDDYRLFEDLDNFAYRAHVKLQRFFQSRWSMTMEGALGLKQYPNQSVIQFYDTGLRRALFQRYREDPVRASILSGSFSLGKSLASMTGLSLTAGGQWYIGDPIQAYSSGIYYYTENDLFDDPYSYENRFVSLQLTQQFTIGFQAKAGVRIERKDYKGTPALDETGELTGETRRDSREEYFITLSKTFRTGWAFPGSFGLFFQYMFRDNPSNDPYYDYQDHIGCVGFSVGL